MIHDTQSAQILQKEDVRDRVPIKHIATAKCDLFFRYCDAKEI